MPLYTEDTGKIFEKAICLVYGIEYKGKYKYSVEEAQRLATRLVKLPELFAPACEHTAAGGARYDFSSPSGAHLSAKTSKAKIGKVAPQEIGQPQPTKFCDKMGILFTSVLELKRYIQENIKAVLPVLVQHTFDCDNIYYNKARDTIKFVRLVKPIDWSTFEYTWTKEWSVWGNSSTLKIKGPSGFVPLVEFQFHSKSRTNMAIRWCYDEFLAVFGENLVVTAL
jgi:hypothetical protein